MTDRGSVSLAGALDPCGGGSDPAKTLTQLVHVGGSVEHTSAPQTSHVGAPESHLVGPGLPYLTLCVPMTGSPPRFHVGLSETATVRRTATSVAYRALAPDIQTNYNSHGLSFWVNIGSCC